MVGRVRREEEEEEEEEELKWTDVGMLKLGEEG